MSRGGYSGVSSYQPSINTSPPTFNIGSSSPPSFGGSSTDFSSCTSRRSKSYKGAWLGLGLVFGIPIGLFLLWAGGIIAKGYFITARNQREWKDRRRERTRCERTRWRRYERPGQAEDVDVEKAPTTTPKADDKEGFIGSEETLTDDIPLGRRIQTIATRPLLQLEKRWIVHDSAPIDPEKGNSLSPSLSTTPQTTPIMTPEQRAQENILAPYGRFPMNAKLCAGMSKSKDNDFDCWTGRMHCRQGGGWNEID